MYQQLVMVNLDQQGRPTVSQIDPELPFFMGEAPVGHTQPWVFAGGRGEAQEA